MRLKEDSGSYHASSIRTRDARHDKSSSEIAKPKAKKDCKKWCRGKEGRHHQGEWKNYNEVHHRVERTGSQVTSWRVLVCKQCRRHLDTCSSWFGSKCRAPNHGHSVPAVDK